MKNRNYFKFQYLIPIIFLVFFLAPSAMAAYDCPISYTNTTTAGTADGTPAIDTAGLISCCYQAADEPYGGISCRPEDDFLQEIGGVVSCETEANLISKAEDQKDLDRDSFNCFTGSTPSTCRESWCPSAGTCIKDNNNPCPAEKNRNNICPGGCGTCDSDSVYCVDNEATDPGIFIAQPAAYDYTLAVACQAKLYGPGGQTGEEQDGSCKSTGKDVANFCDGSCTGCSEGYTESGRSRGACIPFAQRFIEILADGLAIVGGPDADGVYDYSDSGPDSINSINLISDLSQALVWTDPSVPAPIKDVIDAVCADDQVLVWDGLNWLCGQGGLWITDDDIDIYYNVVDYDDIFGGMYVYSRGGTLDPMPGLLEPRCSCDNDAFADECLGASWTHTGDDVCYDQVNGDSSLLYTSSGGGKIGIGTASPEAKLDVANGNLRVRNLPSCDTIDTDATGNFVCGVDEGGVWLTDNDPDIYYNAGNVGIGTDVPVQKLEVAGDGKFTGGDVSAWWGNKAITLRQDDNNSYLSNSDDFVDNGADPTTGFLILTGGGGIKLKYGDSGNTGADGLTLDSSGDVGIGTTDPEEKLQVYGTTQDSAIIKSTVYDGASRSIYMVGPDNDTNKYAKIATEGTNYPITFWTGSASAEKMRITYDGKVGIGTADPGAKLDVEVTDAPIATLGASTNSATGSYSLAIGQDTLADGYAAVAIGWKSDADGYAGFAAGAQSHATGDRSVALGNTNHANGYASVAVGNYSTAEAAAKYAFVAGNYSRARHESATAMGWYADAYAHSSTAIGYNVKAKSMGEFVVGGWNEDIAGDVDTWVDTDPLFVIGNGIDTVNRSNAVTVLKNGNFGIGTSSPSSELSISDGDGLSGTPMIYLNERAIFGYDGVRAASLIGGISGKSIVFDTDGANERMRISTDGTVVIGGTSATATLDIDGGADQDCTYGCNLLRVRSGSYEKFLVDSIGRVGIRAPADDLYRSLTIFGQSGYHSGITLVRNDSSTYSGNLLGDIVFESIDGELNRTGNPSAAIRGYAAETYDAYNKGAYLTFWTKPIDANEDEDDLERMRIMDNGNVGIGITSTSYKLRVEGMVAGTSWTSTSDRRLKRDIKTINNPLDKVLKLRGVEFEWNKEEFKDMGFTEGKKIGLIAQEVEPIIPEIVNTDKDGYKSLQYANITALLIEAVKEQQEMIEELKFKIETLEVN